MVNIMRRYYQAKLTFFQLIIKILIVNLLIIGLYFILVQYLNYSFFTIFFNKYVLMPLFIFLIILFYNLNKNQNRSFYFNENKIHIENHKIHKIPIKDIDLLELLTDLDSIFGYKKVIIYHNKKRYTIILDKHKASKLIKWLEDKVNNYQEPIIDNLYEYL